MSYTLGDCDRCGGRRTFGVVNVIGDSVVRGCTQCPALERERLPALLKKILYLDQFFFSHAFRANEKRFLEAADLIRKLTQLQLLAVPYSSIHEDETYQWARHDELHKFIKATSGGYRFVNAFEVDRMQILRAFRAWLSGESADFEINREDVIPTEVHKWTGYFRIEVGRYYGDGDLMRALKQKSITGLVDLFDGWRKSTQTLDEDASAEFATSGQSYIDVFLQFAKRLTAGDFDALFDSPSASMVVQDMMHLLPEENNFLEKLGKCRDFFASDHFRRTPVHWISAYSYATLKQLVRDGAYTNRARALQKLSGFFYDVKHIATYAPYVDAFVVDQAMADLVAKPTVGLSKRYGTKIFSLSNWSDLFDWLQEIKRDGLTAEHKEGLRRAYPALKLPELSA